MIKMFNKLTFIILVNVLFSTAFTQFNFNAEPQESSKVLPPPTPILDAPVLTTNKNYSTDGRFKLTWTTIEYADTYEIWTYCGGTCIIFMHEETTLTYWNFKEGNGNYSFTVVAVNETSRSQHSNHVTIVVSIVYGDDEPLNILPYVLAFIGIGMVILISYATYKHTKKDLEEEAIIRKE